MANKLKLQSTPGHNAGESYAKSMRISDIIIDPELSKLFVIKDGVLQEIVDSITENGFDKSQPVTIWKNKNILLDGYTRRQAAITAGLEEILISEKDFESREDALTYALERQLIRRNLSSSEILKAVEMLPDERNQRGEGRRAKKLANLLGVSEATIYQAKDVIENSPEEDLQAIRDGDMSLSKGYAKNRQKRAGKPDVDFVVTDAQGLPENVKFLTGAVILLIEAGQQPAAELLINHYLKKHEKKEFYKLLPEFAKRALCVETPPIEETAESLALLLE